ncbi:MAG: phenylalanine--tRNA ligase subunit beta, partial [Rubrivivax sp.]
NLAHALSVYGVAREVSALTGAPLLTPLIESVTASHGDRLPVQVDAPDLCGRFSGRIVRNVNTKATTPAWMVERLARCGQRCVSALVDISNYVMFEYGRPSHIFDLDKIHDKLVVRWGLPGESLKLLNGSTVDIDASVGVIADAQGVESLAGIMGGETTAVSDTTRHVYVEAAFWWPHAVAGRSRRFNFSTDAGHRFERGVDPALTAEHIERITQLILDICGGEPGPLDDQVLSLPQARPVALRVARAAKIIGMPLTQAQCAEVFRRLGFHFSETPGVLAVTPPSWRFDLQIEEDLIEEVARIVGYEQLPDAPPLAPIRARVLPEARRSAHGVRQAMAALGYQETINYSFVEERWEQQLAGNSTPIRVLNPIAAPLAVMRSSLLGSLLGVLHYNLARRAGRVRVFELGRVFRRDPDAADGPASVAGVSQPMRLGALGYGPVDGAQWGRKERPLDFFDLKGDIEALLAPLKPVFVPDTHPALHPGRCARVELGGHAIGHVGELHPQWRQAYELPQAPMLFELELDAVLARDLPMAQAVPRHQASLRDIALVVRDDVAHDRLVSALAQDASGLVRSVTLFDVYRPAQPGGDFAAGEHSMALRLELLDEQANLTDERIDAAVSAAVQRAQTAFAARLRG